MNMDVVNPAEIKKEVEAETLPQEPEKAALQAQAAQNVQEMIALDLSAPEERRNLIKTIDGFGMDSLQASAHKNALLQVSVGNLSKGGEAGNAVSKSLADLQREMKDLDPSLLDFTKEGLLGKVFNPIRQYFRRFEKADSVIEDIMASLEKGKNTLKNDTVSLDIEQEDLRAMTVKLHKELALGEGMDAQISAWLDRAMNEAADEEKIQFVREEVLFPLRQRMMDMQQMVVVNQQGIVAMEVIKRNNKELIRGVDRASTVTVTALKTAVMVASALYNQKIVLRKIELLNETTGNMIAATSKMLKEQGATIQMQASETGMSPDLLKKAFADAMSALESITTFKQQALPQMQQTVATFRELAEAGEREVARLENTREQ